MRRAGLLSCLALLGLAAALLPAAAGAAHASKASKATNGRYSGKTAQSFPLHLRIQGNRAWLIRVKVKLRCGDGGLLYDDLSDFEASKLRANGRFADLQFGPTDEVHWRGRLKGKGVRGSIRVEDKLTNGVRCDSGVVGFSTHR